MPRPGQNTPDSAERSITKSRVVPVTVNGRRQMVTQQVARIRWSSARGRVARNFDDVLVLGSRSLPEALHRCAVAMGSHRTFGL